MKRTAGWDDRPGPFVGPRPFRARDRPFFLGRGREVAALTAAWHGHRLTVLHGDTGVGKTSLVRAGAVPGVTDRGGDVLPYDDLCLDSGFPAAVLPDQNPYGRALVSSWDPEGPPGRSVADLLRTRSRTDRYGRRIPVYAVLDRVELLLRPGGAGEHHRRDLLEELLTCLDGHEELRLLLVVRTDHWDELRRLLDKYTVRFAEIPLHPLTAQAAAEAVDLALDRVGHRLEPGQGRLLAEELCLPVPGTPHRGGIVDPGLLQVVGRALWEALPAGARTLTRDPTADTDRALRAHTARAVAETAAECLVSPRALRAWLARVLESGEQGARAFRGGEEAARALQDRHLVGRHHANGTYLVRHPRLTGPLTSPDPLPEVPRGAASHFSFACRTRTRGDLPVAREHARRALAAQPPPRPRDRARIISLLGDLAFHEGDFPSAARLYQDAAGLRASLGEGVAVGHALLAQARCLLLARDRPAALNALAVAAGRAGADPGMQTGLGQALWQAGQAESALDVLHRVLSRDGANAEARRTRGEILADQGEAVSALRDLERLEAPESPSTRTARALAQATLAGVGTWSEELDEALVEAADSGPVLLRAARVRRLRGDRDLAARLAARAVSAHHPPLPPHQVSTAARLSEEA
ncbi:ATP-binding protein [Nocardiopsis sp. N85]|uniref:nSTAND1 domain-containing NTPase n=1 Tax=Nocardiopsis sp. N85 TaxID=3029400 RepID=UPI00237F21D1|nr:ATP-binding protein [Nocardiopsis sp. N85]MDE3723345.1 ATP-binding protein [Nocardiopsis sp. N85]